MLMSTYIPPLILDFFMKTEFYIFDHIYVFIHIYIYICSCFFGIFSQKLGCAFWLMYAFLPSYIPPLILSFFPEIWNIHSGRYIYKGVYFYLSAHLGFFPP